MAKRWYICPVIGDGTFSNPYRPKVADYGIHHVAVIPSKPDGSPVFPWCMVKVARANGSFVDLDGDGEIDGFPVGIDAQVRDLPAATRTKVRTALEKRGIDTSDVTGATPLRAVLRRVARILDPNFHEDLTDVSE